MKAPSGFSILMKAESIGKLMGKHYGVLGALLYRVATFSGAAARLAMLLFLRALSLWSRVGAGTDFPGAFFKYRLLMLWSLGLKRAAIAR